MSMPVHPSHVLRENQDWADPHSPGLCCTECLAGICLLCYERNGLAADDELALPCEPL